MPKLKAHKATSAKVARKVRTKKKAVATLAKSKAIAPKPIKAKPKKTKAVVTKTKAKRNQLPKTLFVSEVINYVNALPDCYVIGSMGVSIIIAKKITVSVNRINDNPVFQPHESVEKKSYFITACLEIEGVGVYDPDSVFNDGIDALIQANCPMFDVHSLEEIYDVVMRLK